MDKSILNKRIKSLLKFLLFMAFVMISLKITGVSLKVLNKRGYRFFEFLGKMFPIDFSYGSSVFLPLWDTIRMSVAGTFIGAFLGIFTALLSSKNLHISKIIVYTIKVVVQVIRTIPVLIIALICTFFFGIGTFAGTVALSVYTWAILTRIGSELIDATPVNAYEVLVNSGCSGTKAFFRTIFIQFIPGYLENALYVLESNVRQASILGYVGAGGIGLLLGEEMSFRMYARIGTILSMLFVAIVIIEGVSIFLRNYLTGKIRHGKFLNIMMGIVFAALAAVSIFSIQRPDVTVLGVRVAFNMIKGILHPDLAYMFKWSRDGVLYLVFETICIAGLGTIFGAIIALILSLLGSFSLVPKCLAVPVRIVIMAIRTVPVFIYGLMFIRVTGPGNFAGVLTISLCSVGLLSKRFMVSIDNYDKASWNACKAMGVGFAGRVKYCLWPQIKTSLKASVLYRFDVNIREASVLGLVGAGGIGAPLIMYMNNYRWDAVGSILIILFAVILIVEILSYRSR
ncbi:MAG: PhnE/PtxC family ABC transporter permease [Lachnospira sp.]